MANNNYEMNKFDSREDLVDSLSTNIICSLINTINIKGYATLVLSGGGTPKKLLNKLSNSKAPWEKIKVTLVDERWVDTKSEQSNEKFIRDNLLQSYASKARFIPLKNDAITAKNALVSLEVTLEGLSKELDVVVLGMGVDAHTASFFPHDKNLNFALNTNDLCCATTANTEPKERVTLSRSFLLTAKNLILHIEGKEKEETFIAAVNSQDESIMPIIAMMQQKEPILEVYYAN